MIPIHVLFDCNSDSLLVSNGPSYQLSKIVDIPQAQEILST